MNDAVIGEGNYGCSWSKCFDLEHEEVGVSSNSISYSISFSHFSFYGLLVGKETTEGQKLVSLHKHGKVNEFCDYALVLSLQNTDPRELLSRIRDMKEESFNDGRRAMRKEFRGLLGVREFAC